MDVDAKCIIIILLYRPIELDTLYFFFVHACTCILTVKFTMYRILMDFFFVHAVTYRRRLYDRGGDRRRRQLEHLLKFSTDLPTSSAVWCAAPNRHLVRILFSVIMHHYHRCQYLLITSIHSHYNLYR